MNEIKIFEGTQVHIIEVDGEPLFEVYSIGMALGQVKIAKGQKYPRKDRIDENLKSAEIMPVVHNGQLFITEEQLYDLMLEMKTDKVKPFRKWLTSEVLPSIRKTGNYSVTVPKTYGKKSTSAGEVASLIKVLRSIMKDQKSDPAKIAEMAERICKQFGIDIPEELPEKNPFENQMFLIGFMHK